jgi:hypothetical protein
MLAEHKGLAILFAAILLGFGVYAWKILHAPARQRASRVDVRTAPVAPPNGSAGPGSKEPTSPDAASSVQPIYIEAVPDKETR